MFNIEAMVIVIDRNSGLQEIEKTLNNLMDLSHNEKGKPIDAFKYCGIIKLDEDPLTIQKKMRNEWN